VSSPNEPIFHLHHANIDRNFLQWQILNEANFEDDFTFGYPTTGFCEGHNLGDILNSDYPFEGVLSGLSGPHTVEDVLRATHPRTIEYTYSNLSPGLPSDPKGENDLALGANCGVE
jgi:hypothetical protein